METLIKDLIELDKSARKRIEEANEKKEKAVLELEQTKAELQKKSEKAYKEKLERYKAEAIKEIEKNYSPEKCDEIFNILTERMDKIYEEKKEEWAEEIFRKVIG